MRHTPTAVTATALLGALLLAGCGSPEAETTSASQPLSTATESSSEPGSVTPSASSPAVEDAAVDGVGEVDEEQAPFVPLEQAGEAPGSGSGSGAASIVGARVGEHEGYERVVLDLEGAAGEQAGWYVTAVPEPVQEASGEVLNVEGDRFLNVNVTGVANASDGQVDAAGRAAFIGAVQGSGALVEQVYVGGAWEGQAQVLLGLGEGASEYRVLSLGSPQRIVIDVR